MKRARLPTGAAAAATHDCCPSTPARGRLAALAGGGAGGAAAAAAVPREEAPALAERAGGLAAEGGGGAAEAFAARLLPSGVFEAIPGEEELVSKRKTEPTLARQQHRHLSVASFTLKSSKPQALEVGAFLLTLEDSARPHTFDGRATAQRGLVRMLLRRLSAALSLRRGAPLLRASFPPPPAAALAALAPRRAHCDDVLAADATRVAVVFVDSRSGRETRCEGRAGENLVHLAHAAAVDLEGACECSLACSTCHVVLEQAAYAKLEPPGEEEDDLLDLAFGLTVTSRLGCQVKLAPALDGTRVTLPAGTRNFYVDGFKPTPH